MSGPAVPPNPARLAAWTFLAACALLGFWRDWDLVGRTGSIDFRNRVTGARLLVAGEDPYHYKWLPGSPAAWCDLYANRAHPVTKTTVTPSMLLLTGPVAAWPYPVSQRLWLLLEWACLTGVWWVWFRTLTSFRPQLLWSVLLTGFSWTLAWRHHVDRGQYYILLSLLLSLWILGSRDASKTQPALTGALGGLLVALRPPLLLLLAPFVWVRRPDQRQGLAIGCTASCLLPLLFNGGSWGQYFRAMGEWSHLYRHNQNTTAGAIAYPPVIEGLDLDHLSRYAVRQYADSSLFRFWRASGLDPLPAALALVALGIALGLWARANSRSKNFRLLTGIAAWSYLIDFFLPAYRNPYNDVLILGALACLLQDKADPRRALLPAGCFLCSGWLLSGWEPPSLWLIHLPTLACLAVALAALVPLRAPVPAK